MAAMEVQAARVAATRAAAVMMEVGVRAAATRAAAVTMEVGARAAAARATRLSLSVARNLGSRCQTRRGCTHPPVLRRRNQHQLHMCTCWSITRRGHLRRGSRVAEGAALAESWEGVLSLVRLLDGRRAVSISLHVHEPGAHACLAVFGQLDELSRRRR